MTFKPVHYGTYKPSVAPRLPNMMPLGRSELFNLEGVSRYHGGRPESKSKNLARSDDGPSDPLNMPHKPNLSYRSQPALVDDKIFNPIPLNFSTISNLPNQNLPPHDPPRPPPASTASPQPPRGPDASNTQDSIGSPDRSRNPQPRPRPRNYFERPLEVPTWLPEDPAETLQDAIAYLTLVQNEELLQY